MVRIWLRAIVVIGVLVVFAGAMRVEGDEVYSLEVPGEPALRSKAFLSDGGVIIEDAQGVRHLYERRPEHDTADGTFMGWYARESRSYLRWPTKGTGPMYLGSIEGGRIAWRVSRMQVRPMDGGAPLARREPGERGAELRPLAMLATLDRPDQLWLAHVDLDGVLQFYERRGRKWQHRASQFSERLPAGIPLALIDDLAGDRPRVYFLDEHGGLTEIRNGRTSQPVAIRGAAPRFYPFSQLASVPRGAALHLAAADVRGRLWEFVPELATFVPIESRGDLFEPGCPMVAVEATDTRLFAIDRRGHLLGYRSASDRWSPPVRVAGNLIPGGFLAAATAPDDRLSVAGVDFRGQAHVWTETAGVWEDEVCPDASCVPGGGIALTAERGPLSVSAVTVQGRWMQWETHRGRWSRREIADGFLPGCPVTLFSVGPTACSIDPAGRVIAAIWETGVWRPVICLPNMLNVQTVIHRTVVPGEPLPPVRVEFVNSHTEELVARILDDRSSEPPREVIIGPGRSATVALERTPGAALEETFTVIGPQGDLIQEQRQIALPAPQQYTVVLYANRVTSQYFDRTRNKTNVPDEVNLSRVSLGAFPLPPGPELRDGMEIDAYRTATAQRNPGAAAILDRSPP